MESLTRMPLRTARTAMVASANPLASLIGVEILRSGGNAADSAVAMGAALAVMEPHNSHLGGDAAAQIWDAPAQRISALNGSGAAPAGATLEAIGNVIPERGIRSVSVPGAVDAWLTTLSRWGTLTASEALAPAIALAEDGYALPAWQAALLQAHEELWNEYPESGAALVPNSLRPGVTVYQPTLARILRQIADGGRAAFYEGEFAEKLLAYSSENGGFFTREDLAGHRTQITDPIKTTLPGRDGDGKPAGLAGAALLLQMLNILEGYDLAGLAPGRSRRRAFDGRSEKAGVCRQARLSRRHPANAAGDAAFQRVCRKPAQASEFGRCRRAVFAGPGLPTGSVGSDTTSFCVVDARGNAVSWIQSVAHRFGSGGGRPWNRHSVKQPHDRLQPGPEKPERAVPRQKADARAEYLDAVPR